MDDNIKARQEELRKSIDELKIAIEKVKKRNERAVKLFNISLFVLGSTMLVAGVVDTLIIIDKTNAVRIIYNVINMCFGIGILNIFRKGEK